MTVGSRAIDLTDPVQQARIPLWLWYPAAAAETTVSFGPYPVSIAPDAPVVGDDLPLVVISHGTGSSPWLFRGLAGHLVGAGFAVALVEHPGNSRNDDSLAHTPANLANRPRHVRRAIDAAFGDALVGPHLRAGAVFLIGHSLGACTMLAVAGGRPSTMPHETADRAPRPVPVDPADPRVRGLVLLAPAVVWYVGDGALDGVTAPVLMMSGERDTAVAGQPAIVERGLRGPGQVTHHVIENAGHFAFVSPFPPALQRPDFLPAQDPAGFDRAAYQPVLHREIVSFLRAHG